MNLYIIIPFISGILLSLSNLFIKNGVSHISSFSIPNLIFNGSVMLGFGIAIAGGSLMWYSLKILPLWVVILTINTITIVGSVVLGVFYLKEIISPVKSILVVLIISLLIILMAIK